MKSGINNRTWDAVVVVSNENNGTATPKQIAQRLGVSEVTAKQRLAIFRDQGHITYGDDWVIRRDCSIFWLTRPFIARSE